jgi:hypothetical protein
LKNGYREIDGVIAGLELLDGVGDGDAAVVKFLGRAELRDSRLGGRAAVAQVPSRRGRCVDFDRLGSARIGYWSDDVQSDSATLNLTRTAEAKSYNPDGSTMYTVVSPRAAR